MRKGKKTKATYGGMGSNLTPKGSSSAMKSGGIEVKEPMSKIPFSNLKAGKLDANGALVQFTGRNPLGGIKKKRSAKKQGEMGNKKSGSKPY